MKKINHFILFAILLFINSSCIHEKIEDCIYTLRFKYNYNMDFVDKFAEQAETLHLFIFDDNDLFVKKIEQSGDELKNSKIELNLTPENYGKEFTFLAWVGIDNENISYTSPIIGKTSIHEMELALNSGLHTKQAFKPLMVGELTTIVQPQKVDNIFLIKNTNKFRITIKLDSTDSNNLHQLKSENYNIYIESNNTRYNKDNQIISNNIVHYYPYYKKDNDNEFLVEINTLRIVDNRHNELVIEDTNTSHEQIRIDLNKYLEELRSTSYPQMQRQEFFDREDDFSIVVFLTNTKVPNWFGIEINGWFIRFQEYDSDL